MKICVLGAGVVGLNSALEIQKENHNVEVTIVADKFNEETTSDGAAGVFIPLSHYKGPSKEIAKQWVNDAYCYYSDLMENNPESGVKPVSGCFLSNISLDICENEFMRNVSSNYRLATEEEKNQYNIKFKYGIYYSTMVIPCRKYLPWSMQKFKRNGGNVIQSKIYDVNELAKDFDVLFNCTGLNSKYLFNDNEIIPIRGQIIQVRAPWVKTFCHTDINSYIIPLGFDNLVALGGIYDYGNYDTSIDQFIMKSIIYRCTEMLPRLRTSSVVRKWTGLRPYRPVIRVEVEVRNNLKIIHNYGHGGSGVTVSPGTSKHAVFLFNNLHRASGSSKL